MSPPPRPSGLKVALVAVVLIGATVGGGLFLLSTDTELEPIPVEDLPPTPVASWRGPSRPAADCPKFMAKGPELFDMRRLGDPSTLQMEVYDRRVVQVGTKRIALRSVSFMSYEMDGCELRPIRIQAQVALPVVSEGSRGGRLPGIVRAHGLLPHQEQEDAARLSAAADVAVVAYTGPGLLDSEGWDSRPDHMFDAVQDPRRSWLWSQAATLIRGLTFLEARSEVDPERLGVLGASAGGLAALIAAGTDPRVRAAVIWSASGYLDLAARATPVPGWEAALLQQMEPSRTPDSPQWQAFEATLDPRHFLPSLRAPTMLIAGAQDQYFPIHAVRKTFDTMMLNKGADHRLYIIAGFDHGPIADKVMTQIRPRVMSDTVYWFKHHFGTADQFKEEVPVPKVEQVRGVECCPRGRCQMCTHVEVALPRGTQYELDGATLQLSTDRARSFVGHEMTLVGRRFEAELPMAPEVFARAASFAEITYRPLGKVRRIRVTSRPSLPEGFVPRIWPDARVKPASPAPPE